MKILFILTSGLLCFSLYSQERLSAPLSSSQVIANYSEAIEQEDNEAALQALNKVLVGDSSYALIQAQRSQMLITLERYEEAIDVCKEGLNIPRSTFSQVFRLNHGMALGALEKYDEAMKVYQELKRDMPFYPSVWNNIAALYLSKKEYDKAHVAYQEMAQMFPFDGVSHFNLGIFAYNEGHFTEAFMAFNMVILLEPYTQRAHSVLVLLNEIANNSKAEKTPKDGFEIASDEYQEIDLLIKNYVALSKKYKVPGKNQIFMAKQNHLIFSQLNKKESTDYFYSQFYEPFYDQIIAQGKFEGMQLLELIPSKSERDSKIVEKEMKQIKEFNTWFQNEWYGMNKYHEINYRDLKGKHQMWYLDNGSVKSVGNANADLTKSIGNFCYFGKDGVLISEGNYGENGLNGLWKYYYESGIKKREIIYKDGAVISTVRLFDEEGQLDEEFGYSNGDRNGNFKQFYKHGGLYKRGINVKGKLEGSAVYYFKNGKKEYDVQYKDGLLTGKLKEYYATGDIYREEDFLEGNSEGAYKLSWLEGTDRILGTKKEGEFEGVYTSYFRNGKLSEEGQFSKGKRNGIWKDYYLNGNLSEISEYSSGKLEGTLKLFDKDGLLYSEKVFRNNFMISYKFYDKLGNILSQDESKKKQYTLENYHPNGTIESRGDYKANVGYVGSWESFDEYGNTLYKYAYEEGKLQGKTEKYFPTGQLELVKYYKEGDMNGYFVSYYPHGQIEQQGYYEEGDIIGLWEAYYEDGTLEWQRNFFSNQKTGANIEYDVAGKLDYLDKYDNGIFNGATYFDTTGATLIDISFVGSEGEYKQVHLNKQPAYVGKYSTNSKEGIFRWYYANGQLQSEGTYLNNKKQGDWIGYHESGKLEYKGKYVIGSKEGLWEYYSENGKKSDLTPYLHDDIHGLNKEFNNNGTKQAETMYENGSKHGETKFYDDNGAYQMARNYNYGEIVGYSYLEPSGAKKEMKVENGSANVRAFFKNGKPSRQFDLKNGYFNGPYKGYFENGQIEVEYLLDKNEREGVYKMYFDNGKVRRELFYVHGLLNGLGKDYFKNGKLKETVTYKNGVRHGAGIVYKEDGTIKTKYLYYDGVRYDA